MHRNLLRVALVLIFLLLVTAVSQAQIDPSPQPDEDVIIVPDPPRQMIAGVASLPTIGRETNALTTPFVLTAEEPADSCSEATPLIVNPEIPADGGVANVKDATASNDDPVLSCMWGNPQRPQGYRTVWYQLIAPVSGQSHRKHLQQ